MDVRSIGLYMAEYLNVTGLSQLEDNDVFWRLRDQDLDSFGIEESQFDSVHNTLSRSPVLGLSFRLLGYMLSEYFKSLESYCKDMDAPPQIIKAANRIRSISDFPFLSKEFLGPFILQHMQAANPNDVYGTLSDLYQNAAFMGEKATPQSIGIRGFSKCPLSVRLTGIMRIEFNTSSGAPVQYTGRQADKSLLQYLGEFILTHLNDHPDLKQALETVQGKHCNRGYATDQLLPFDAIDPIV